MTGLDSQKGSAPPLECDLDLGQSYDIAAEVGSADVVTHAHLTAKGYDSWACDGATLN